MAHSYPVNFRILIPEPVEVKMVRQTLKDRDAIDMLERFRGLFTYVVEEDTFFYLGDGIENKDWKPIGKPHAVIIYDTFTDQKQTIISGHGLKEYLQQNYYTKQQVDSIVAGLQVPPHLTAITPEEVQKLKTIQGDIARRIDFPEAKILWLIPHEPEKSVTCYLPNGREIFGRKINVTDKLTSVNYSQPVAGYALIN